MQTPCVSVIIPIYGVEKYIERCARSLFLQTLSNIEFIFVNDCTRDNSIKVLQHIIDEYPSVKDKVKIFHHEENKGLPAARKTGINNAHGLYIAHCDSDDWVEPDIYEKLYKAACLNNADIVLCDYNHSDSENKIPFHRNLKCSKKEYIVNKALTGYELNPIWATLIKKDLYNNIVTPVSNHGEDKTFIIQLFLKSKKVYYLRETLYNYFFNTVSMSKVSSVEATINRFKQYIKNQEIIINAIQYDVDYKKYEKALDVYKCSAKWLLYYNLNIPECKRQWDAIYPELKYKILLNSKMSLKLKIMYLFSFFGYIKKK